MTAFLYKYRFFMMRHTYHHVSPVRVQQAASGIIGKLLPPAGLTLVLQVD